MKSIKRGHQPLSEYLENLNDKTYLLFQLFEICYLTSMLTDVWQTLRNFPYFKSFFLQKIHYFKIDFFYQIGFKIMRGRLSWGVTSDTRQPMGHSRTSKNKFWKNLKSQNPKKIFNQIFRISDIKSLQIEISYSNVNKFH